MENVDGKLLKSTIDLLVTVRTKFSHLIKPFPPSSDVQRFQIIKNGILTCHNCINTKISINPSKYLASVNR